MYRNRFDKVEFQKSVENNVKRLYRKTVEEGYTAAVIPGSILFCKKCNHRQMACNTGTV